MLSLVCGSSNSFKLENIIIFSEVRAFVDFTYKTEINRVDTLAFNKYFPNVKFARQTKAKFLKSPSWPNVKKHFSKYKSTFFDLSSRKFYLFDVDNTEITGKISYSFEHYMFNRGFINPLHNSDVVDFSYDIFNQLRHMLDMNYDMTFSSITDETQLQIAFFSFKNKNCYVLRDSHCQFRFDFDSLSILKMSGREQIYKENLVSDYYNHTREAM